MSEFIIVSNTMSITNTHGFVIIDSSSTNPTIIMNGVPTAGDQISFQLTGPSNAFVIDPNGTTYELLTTGSKLVLGYDGLSYVLIDKHAINIAHNAFVNQLGPANPSSNAWYGYDVSMSTDGSYLAIGSPTSSLSGTVHLYQRIGSVWQFVTKIDSPDPHTNRFGCAVSLNANASSLAIGAFGSNVGGDVYIYERSGSVWTMLQRIQEPFPTVNVSAFGYVVALDAQAKRLVIGDPISINNLGACYIYVRPNISSNFTIETVVTSSTGSNYQNQGYILGTGYDGFGTSIAINADCSRIVIGAPNEYYNNNAYGRTHIFTRTGSIWAEEANLYVNINSKLGRSVSLNAIGDKLIIGAGQAYQQAVGYAHIYKLNNGTWSLEKTLTMTASNNFGSAVKLSANGSIAIVGAINDNLVTNRGGAVYVYQFEDADWKLVNSITPSNVINQCLFGNSIAINRDGSKLVVGAFRQQTNNILSGAAYTFN